MHFDGSKDWRTRLIREPNHPMTRFGFDPLTWWSLFGRLSENLTIQSLRYCHE
jgi:hypothetical protein